MTYNSKKTLASMGVGVALLVAYILYALGEKAPLVGDLKAWAVLALVFIGIGIGGSILIQILFHIAYAVGVAVKERGQSDAEVERIISASVVEDERDGAISLRASRIGYACAGVGIMAALVGWALGSTAVVGLHMLLGGFFLSSFAEGVASIYLYERGIRHG